MFGFEFILKLGKLLSFVLFLILDLIFEPLLNEFDLSLIVKFPFRGLILAHLLTRCYLLLQPLSLSHLFRFQVRNRLLVSLLQLLYLALVMLCHLV